MGYVSVPGNTGGSGSSSSSTWASLHLSRAQAAAPTIDSYWYTDVIASNEFTTGAFNALGTVTFTGDPNAVLVSSTAGGAGRTGHGIPTGAVNIIPAPAAGNPFYVCWRAKLVGAADAQSIHRLVVYDGTSSLAFSLVGATDPTRWYFTGSTGATFATAGAGAASLVDFASYHDLALFSTGTVASLAVDGTVIATHSTPALWPVGPCCPSVLAQNQATAADRRVSVDKWFAAWVKG